MSMVRRIARPMLAAVFIAEGVDVIRHPQSHTRAAAPWVARVAEATRLPDRPEAYVRVSGAAMVAAGALLATSLAPRVAGWTLAGILVPATALGRPFWKVEDSVERAEARAVFVRNVSLVGAALLAGVDTDGRPSVAWRRTKRREEVKAQRAADEQTDAKSSIVRRRCERRAELKAQQAADEQ